VSSAEQLASEAQAARHAHLIAYAEYAARAARSRAQHRAPRWLA